MTLKRRLRDAERIAGTNDEGITVIRLELAGLEGEPDEEYIQPVSPAMKARAERLAAKHGHTFKANMIPAEIWDAE